MVNLRKTTKKKVKIFKYRHFISITMGVLIYLFYRHIKDSPDKIEFGYSRAVYPYIAEVLSIPGRLVPVSVSELVILFVLFILLVFFLIRFYHVLKKRISFPVFILKCSVDALAIGAAIYFLFLTTWGLNYLRQPFSEALALDTSQVLTESGYESLAMEMAGLTASLYGSSRESETEREGFDVVAESAVINVIESTEPARSPSTPKTKCFFTNEWMNAFGVSGVFIPIFMEPHLNAELIPWEVPFVMAHEKAHFYGFASETDANLIAYMACISSDSPSFKYSGALRILLSLHSYMPRERWMEIIKKLPPGVRDDISKRSAHLAKNRERYSLLLEFGKKSNDTYLKLNSQKSGIKSYRAAIPQFLIWWKNRSSGYVSAYPLCRVDDQPSRSSSSRLKAVISSSVVSKEVIHRTSDISSFHM